MKTAEVILQVFVCVSRPGTTTTVILDVVTSARAEVCQENKYRPPENIWTWDLLSRTLFRQEWHWVQVIVYCCWLLYSETFQFSDVAHPLLFPDTRIFRAGVPIISRVSVRILRVWRTNTVCTIWRLYSHVLHLRARSGLPLKGVNLHRSKSSFNKKYVKYEVR